MNEMATAEYLLKKWVECKNNRERINNENEFEYFFYGAMFYLEQILEERFGMKISHNETEYIAYNSVCCISVKIQGKGE